MNIIDFKNAFLKISNKINENKDYLIKLDQQNGDGDLGISMSEGFAAVIRIEYLEADLGKYISKVAFAFNEAAPSSLGTILSFFFMGMAKSLKGKEEIELEELSKALSDGVNKVMEKACSRPGERTILDSIYPAIKYLVEHPKSQTQEVFKIAAIKATEGAEKTKEMLPVHGRAAMYGEKSLGSIDGGAMVGKIIFEAISE